jgi:hypothetical protein
MPNEPIEDGAKQWILVAHVAKLLQSTAEEASDIFCSSPKPETGLSMMLSSVTIDGKLFVPAVCFLSIGSF